MFVTIEPFEADFGISFLFICISLITAPCSISTAATGTEMCAPVSNGYIRTRDLVSKNNWFKNDERIIILPMSIEERLANLIKKGTYVDIRLKKEASDIVETILYKLKVEDVLDETGVSLDSKSGMNSRTAYMKLVLNKDERQKIYTAEMAGKLIYELYCDETQKPIN
jgi:hypothetical protein